MILVSVCRILNGLADEINLFWRCSSPLKLKKVSYDFWLKTLRDSKFKKTAKDHGKSPQSRLAASFSGIVHHLDDFSSRPRTSTRLLSTGPVKIINRVKIAHSLLQSVSDQFHIIILACLCKSTNGCKEFFETQF